MLSIGTLRDGKADYYLHAVAHGAEDYYVGRGEAPGRWLGSLADELGLEGRVGGEDLRQVLAGRDPVGGIRLSRTRHRRVPGFDLTLCAPKSVSVLWGLGDSGTAREVRDAHDTAVNAAVGYLETHACWSRRGTNGVNQVRGEGFVAAGFRHRTSRTGDPHLHTHVLIANATRSSDGWGTLDGRHLFLHAKTAGYLYQAQLRAELTRRLGVDWTSVHHGSAEIIGVPKPVLQLFATRSDEIRAEMAERGVSSARAAQYAALSTRRAKDGDVDPASLHSRWSEQAATLGFGDDQVEALIGRVRLAAFTEERVDAIQAELLGPDGLTKQASTFDRRDVLRAWCERLPQGADVSTIEDVADRTLADLEVVPLRPEDQGPTRTMRRRTTGRSIDTPATGVRYSTQSLLALETRLIRRATAHTANVAGVADEDEVLAALAARPRMSAEQVEMVASLTTSGRAVDVVIAAAGTGKTFSLDAARDAWQHCGYRVIGAALSARAAAELEATAGIPSHTVARLLGDLDDPDHGSLPKNTVLVVDEAGMVGTRLLARVLDHADTAGAKVVLVGDPRQLPEIDAGGLLRGLGVRIEPIRLTQNRRQHEAWERAALTQLRDGHVDDAVAAYDDHGRIHTSDTAVAARDAMTADWWAATLAGDRTLMLAGRWSDVDDLNARARHHRQAAGELSGPILTIDQRPYQAGDRIMTLRNNRRLGARNGTCATIEHVDERARTMRARTDAGIVLDLPAEYLDAGHVRHAYATTIHKAQGQTVDRAFVLGSDTLYQEAGYVALSRGRAENRIYLVDAGPRPEAHTPEVAPPEPLGAFTRALKTSHAQHLAVDGGIDRAAIHDTLAALLRERARLRALREACPPSRAYEITTFTDQRDAIAERLEDARDGLEALDCQQGWRNRKDRTAQRLVLANQTSDLSVRLTRFDDALDRSRHEHSLHEQYVASHRGELDQLPHIEHAINARVQQLVHADTFDPPHYLRGLGAPPDEPAALDRWRHAAQQIERHRAEHGITDPNEPLGPQPPGDLDLLWHMDKLHLDELITKIDNPTPNIDFGIELG